MESRASVGIDNCRARCRVDKVDSSQVHVLEAVAGSAEVSHLSLGVGLAGFGSLDSGGEPRLLRLHTHEGTRHVWLAVHLGLFVFDLFLVTYDVCRPIAQLL